MYELCHSIDKMMQDVRLNVAVSSIFPISSLLYMVYCLDRVLSSMDVGVGVGGDALLEASSLETSPCKDQSGFDEDDDDLDEECMREIKSCRSPQRKTMLQLPD